MFQISIDAGPGGTRDTRPDGTKDTTSGVSREVDQKVLNSEQQDRDEEMKMLA